MLSRVVDPGSQIRIILPDPDPDANFVYVFHTKRKLTEPTFSHILVHYRYAVLKTEKKTFVKN